jgi:hypothetical protein
MPSQNDRGDYKLAQEYEAKAKGKTEAEKRLLITEYINKAKIS